MNHFIKFPNPISTALCKFRVRILKKTPMLTQRFAKITFCVKKDNYKTRNAMPGYKEADIQRNKPQKKSFKSGHFMNTRSVN